MNRLFRHQRESQLLPGNQTGLNSHLTNYSRWDSEKIILSLNPTLLLSRPVKAWHCSSCEVAYKAKGCFQDSPNRVLKEQVLNERDKTSKVYGGRVINWRDWNNYMQGFACRCAKIVKAKGYKVFGLQFYGKGFK